jgi:hypothetical protein
MKTIKMICVAVALCVPALASAQRGGGAGAVRVQRAETVQRVDTGRMITVRDIDVRRGDVVRVGTVGTVETGTRIRRPLHNPARRRWNAAHPPAGTAARRRYYNATH